MSSKTRCPNENTREWKLLVEKHKGLKEEAYKEWDSLDGSYPTDILTKVEQEEGVSPKTEEYSGESISYLREKDILLQKSKTIIELKIKKLSNIMKGNENLTKAEKEFRELLVEMNNNSADIALHRFILAGNRMSRSAKKWMEELKKEDEPSLDKLRQINEFVQSFSIIDEIKEEFFNDPEHKEDYKVVNDISTIRKDIKNDFIKLSRQVLAKQFTPYFSKIEANARVDAERKFNKVERDRLKEQGLSGKDLAEAKSEYISNYMRDNAVRIQFATEDYLNSMLMQTVDVNSTIAWAVNPKDMNNDIVSLAVDQLDKADYEIQQKTIAARDRLERANNAFIKEVGKSGNPAEQYKVLLTPGNQIISKRDKGWVEFKNEYQGTAVWELHSVLVELIEEKQKLVPRWAQIGYAIPSVNKSNMERAYSNGLLETLKQGTIDHFKVRAEDTDFGNVDISVVEEIDGKKVKEVVVSESGKEREVIPIFYRQKISKEDLSMDIVSSILLDYNNSLNFKAKSESSVVLDVLKEVVSSGDIKKKANFTKITKAIKGTLGREVTESAEGSNIVKTLDHLIRHRIYGINVEGDPAVAKVVGSLGNYSSVIGMAVNHISAVTNVLQGTTMSTIEAMGNSTGLFNLKNKANAIAKYHMDDLGILGDIGQRVPKSKTNKLVEMFNAFSEYHALDKRFVDNNTAKRLANTGTLMGMQSMGEHYVQSVVMYSILDNIKVKNAKGQYLNKEFKPTDKREEAISLDSAYVVNEDGVLDLHPSVTSTDRTPGVGMEDMRKISKLIRRANRDFYGNYDASNKAAVQRHVLGNQMLKMRGWLVPGMQKRWRGFGNINTKLGEEDLDRKSFNVESGQFEEGTYTTAARFLWNMRSELATLKLQTVPETWNNLTDAERGRIKTTIAEAGFALLAWLVYSLAADGDDPEDVYIALYARRLYSELTTFANPIEGVRTLRSPAVGLSTVEAGLELVMQAGSDSFAVLTGGEAERYKSGRRKDELKIKRRLTKLVPVWKQLDRTAKESLDFLLQ